MNARAIIVLFLVLSLALVPVLLAVPVRAQGQYTEKLDVYSAGKDAYWLMTFNQLNSSVPSLAAAESGASGVTGYKLVALSTQSETTDYQIFGTSGYNVLGLPYTPSQGLFLCLNASSRSAGASLIAYFNSRFGTSFSLVSSTGAGSVYFAPAEFGSIAAPILLKLVPTSEGGFASFTPESSFLGLPMPVIELIGTYNGTSFEHSVAIGAATSSFVGTGSAVSISELIGSTNATLTTSSKSSNSEVVIHSLDGLVISSDKAATISDDTSSFSGTYSLSVGAGKAVSINATVQAQPPVAVAYRVLDHGALTFNSTLGVTIFIANTATSGVLQNVTVNDDWWQSYPTIFQLTKGNYSFGVPGIAAGRNVNESYSLRVLSNASQQVVIPSAPVGFAYDLSSSSYQRSVTLGQSVIQVNNVGPAISVTARASVASGTALGTAASFSVTVTNDGNSPAFSIKLANYTFGSLASSGGSHVFNVPISLVGLRQTNFSRTLSLQYSNGAGQTQNVTSNSVMLVLSHSSMVIPFVSLTAADTLSASTLASGNVNVTYNIQNTGRATSTGVAVTEALPAGVQCVAVEGSGSCNGGGIAIGIPSLNTTAETIIVELAFTKDNFIIPAASVTAAYKGLSLQSQGAGYVIPAGISVTKTFAPDFGFPGASSMVTVGISNEGTLPVFNATVTSEPDPFDASPTGTTQQNYPTISPKQTESFNYSVTLVSSSLGNVSSAPTSTIFIFGGSTQEFALGASTFLILSPIVLSVTSSPTSPQENHDFTLTLTITNPSSVDVTNVVYTLNVPSGLSVVSGGTAANKVLTVSVPSLAGKSNVTVPVKLTASTDLTINTGDSHLTFQYLGSTFSGTLPTLKVVIGVDVTTRYTLPIIVAVFAALAAIVYVRRRVGTVAAP